MTRGVPQRYIATFSWVIWFLGNLGLTVVSQLRSETGVPMVEKKVRGVDESTTPDEKRGVY